MGLKGMECFPLGFLIPTGVLVEDWAFWVFPLPLSSSSQSSSSSSLEV
jgi:hypothetical protein